VCVCVCVCVCVYVCVWCGSVSYPRAAVFHFKNNCSAIVNGAAPDDGDV
jgi:hypothetical protein